MRKPSILSYLFFVIIFVLLAVPVTSYSQSPDSTAPANKNEKEQANAKEPPPATVIQFYTWAGLLPKNFVDLQEKINTGNNVDQVNQEIPAITADIKALLKEVEEAKQSETLRTMQVDNLQLKLNRLKNQITKSSKPLTDFIAKLSKWRNEWTKKKEELAEFEKQEQLELALAIEPKEALDKTINSALELIEKHLTPSLVLGKKLADLQVQLHTIDSDLRELDAGIRRASTQQTSPSILSPAFYMQINGELFAETYKNIVSFTKQSLQNFVQSWRKVLLVLFILTGLNIAISYSKNMVTTSSAWYPFSTCPLAASVFILTTSYNISTQFFSNIKPGYEWAGLINVITILAVIRLIKCCIDRQLARELLTRLSWFMAITMLLTTLELPQLLILFFVFYASIAALLIYAYQLKFKSQNGLGHWLKKSWGILPLMIMLSGIMGYDQFAINAFTTLLNTVGACLVIWMLYRFNCGFLELILSRIPSTLLQDNLTRVVKSLQPFLAWLHGILLVAALSVIWNLYSSIDIAIKSLNNIGFSLGDINISPGFILTVIFVLYGALLFSRASQALLLKNILPRYYVEKGVQLSITRLVHYAIVTVGFFLTLRVLGFELKQLTILGGALGIGIGFGLQAIVTNFASGLILLFERPIKVGDTIQVGGEFGEVKNLGLRATIIQTFDNAEIVVPNSDLVTGQVTNWTLGERRVRVKIPVGVAYGTNVSKVMEILVTCAEQNPMVLSTPKPVALFLSFGASSLDFELRAWIPEFLDKLTCLSELNQAIEEEFAQNGIEIPFQQTDLHIRSFDEQAAQVFRSRTED